jgi:palmitoyltransferase
MKALEAGVARKPIDERNVPGPSRRPGASGSPGTTPHVERPYDDHGNNGSPHPHPANLPPMHDTPHKFPWAGVKIQILIIMTSLIAPTNARRNGPGNPIVQKQLLDRGGIMPLLNCCVYDGHNEYLKERATLAIKFVMEGSEEAQKFVRDLVPVKQAQAQAQARAQAENRQKASSSAAGKGVHLAAEALAADLARTAASTAASFKSGQDESLQRALGDVKIGEDKNGDQNGQAKASGSGSGGGKGKGKAKK